MNKHYRIDGDTRWEALDMMAYGIALAMLGYIAVKIMDAA